MTITEMKKQLNAYGSIINEALGKCFKNYHLCVSAKLCAAMEHSLMGGGKKIRPALFLAWAQAGNANLDELSPFAAAIEMIHTYSLIHDDLPPMDNADIRRGKPSCHKKFGEATALLAGDGLLTDAFYVMTKTNAAPANLLQAIRKVALAAGSSGMVDGQMMDLQSDFFAKSDLAILELLQAKKTGAMIAASCQCGVILADAVDEFGDIAFQFGTHFGAAFQIYDDVLDVIGESEKMGKPGGIDQINERRTWPGMIGLENSISRAQREAAIAISLIQDIPEPVGSFLRALSEYVINRNE